MYSMRLLHSTPGLPSRWTSNQPRHVHNIYTTCNGTPQTTAQTAHTSFLRTYFYEHTTARGSTLCFLVDRSIGHIHSTSLSLHGLFNIALLDTDVSN